MTAAKKKTKGPAKQAPSSPKHAEAKLRRELYVQLEAPECTARDLLDSINKLRHGNLDYISKMSEMQSMCDALAETLGDIGQAIKDHA